MLIQKVVEIIGIPFVVLLILTVVKALSDENPIGPEKAADIGMDLAILAVGACGGIFSNDALVKRWGMQLINYGTITALGCVLSLATLALIRHWQPGPANPQSSVSTWQAMRNIFLGAIPLGLAASVLIFGYQQ
jgi:hypothetical protein